MEESNLDPVTYLTKRSYLTRDPDDKWHRSLHKVVEKKYFLW